MCGPRQTHSAQCAVYHGPAWPNPHGHSRRARRSIPEAHHLYGQPGLKKSAHLTMQPCVSDVVTARDDADIRDGPPKDQTSSMISGVSPT